MEKNNFRTLRILFPLLSKSETFAFFHFSFEFRKLNINTTPCDSHVFSRKNGSGIDRDLRIVRGLMVQVLRLIYPHSPERKMPENPLKLVIIFCRQKCVCVCPFLTPPPPYLIRHDAKFISMKKSLT